MTWGAPGGVPTTRRAFIMADREKRIVGPNYRYTANLPQWELPWRLDR